MSNHQPPCDDDAVEPIEVFPERELDLRAGADACYKCTTCETSCPVAAVDDEFPGPKFQGPEQWRLKRKEDADIDDSILSCSNCLRCDSACPSEVPLAQMHNEARGEYVDEQMNKLSREYLRNRILANYGLLAKVGSKVPRLVNFVMGLSVTRKLNEKLLGLPSEREFPAFATQTFREWWRERGGAQVESDDKRVAYFHGCYSNYNTPEVGKAMVRVFEEFGYEVLVPEQRCSGTPMFANGMLSDARRAAETNVESLAAAIDDDADIVASCTSCSLSLRKEYPELFDIDRIDDVSEHTYEALEYLRIHEDLESAVTDAEVDHPALAYHAPCHARNQGLDRQAVELFREVDGVAIEDVGDSCSGISGTYGWKAEKYEASMAMGEEMFHHMEQSDGEVGMTECPTCAMQMEHGTGYEIKHPLQVLEAAVVSE
ncbi:Fe-S oxidoreductase [Halalkaliarchaeum sp. AArc-CO]|uniref:anaerobic glycerol-3-phosphate dehydrogenase subunit C n=1 Tax=unclassified Halalkaliarchaeum TaxID=2678344 RepID=UPI00217DB51F|nr:MULTISPECIES: anaerobic glycerol-3-phosphate dehydrogenase subunit C [unclassified Halalkaliarchaeum]MDR5673853.1 anaerobic glycerol-3-phosphate dehydrogenase subunit C [Halalkaliarchaeum sp. AArc-GB]UWG50933.1 Fe-S oxidoreductase [Halalkaliarchaeum sp. AArc-CO]